jgi:DNA-directed RNA polymerase subunit RPC12/RpoP
MAVVPIKFRCYQCNQLLGVARSKAGTVVNCPKCSAGLIVPDLTEPSEPGPNPEPPQELSSGPERQEPQPTGAPGLEDLLAEIRVEDIRVEPGVATEPVPAAARVEAPAPVPNAHETPAPAASSDRVEEPSVIMLPTPDPAPAVAPANVVVPPINFDQRRAVVERDRGPGPRPRDVNLPRSVVLAWSLFVLIALALAFAAGLLAGHFLWKVH